MALGRLITCACGTEARAHAKGMCMKCYNKWKYENNPEYRESCQRRAKKWQSAGGESHPDGTCAACGKEKQIKGRGMCSACYMRTRKAEGYSAPERIAVCVRCKKEKDISGGGGGMCKICYHTDNRYGIEHRLRVQGVPGSHTDAEWQALKKRFRNRCGYCQRHESECGPLTRDHFIPVYLGERSSDAIVNIFPACGGCNSIKGNQLDVSDAHSRGIFQRFMAIWEEGGGELHCTLSPHLAICRDGSVVWDEVEAMKNSAVLACESEDEDLCKQVMRA